MVVATKRELCAAQAQELLQRPDTLPPWWRDEDWAKHVVTRLLEENSVLKEQVSCVQAGKERDRRVRNALRKLA